MSGPVGEYKDEVWDNGLLVTGWSINKVGVPEAHLKSINSKSKGVNLHEWHRRLGHVSYDSIIQTAKEKSAVGLNMEDIKDLEKAINCEACLKGKMIH